MGNENMRTSLSKIALCMIALVALLPNAMAASGSVTADGITGECTATGTGDASTHWRFECTSGSNTASDDGTGAVYVKTLRVVSTGCVTATLWADGVVVDAQTTC